MPQKGLTLCVLYPTDLLTVTVGSLFYYVVTGEGTSLAANRDAQKERSVNTQGWEEFTKVAKHVCFSVWSSISFNIAIFLFDFSFPFNLTKAKQEMALQR